MEEAEKHQKSVSEWQAKLEIIRKQERDVLEIRSEPLRKYLMKYIMPSLTAALVEVARLRPEDPIDFIAEYLFNKSIDSSSLPS